MSALPPKADIRQRGSHIRLVPEADIKLLTQTLPSPSSLPGRIEELEPFPK